MSDHVQILVDTEASPRDAKRVGKAVAAALLKSGVIRGRPMASCVLEGKGYLPGADIAALAGSAAIDEFWTLETCGVEVRIERTANDLAVGPAWQGSACPQCHAKFPPFQTPIDDLIVEALDSWLAGDDLAVVDCPECHSAVSLKSWHCQPKLGLGHFAVYFWNWPPLDADGWAIDIPALIREVTRGNLERTHGIL